MPLSEASPCSWAKACLSGRQCAARISTPGSPQPASERRSPSIAGRATTPNGLQEKTRPVPSKIELLTDPGINLRRETESSVSLFFPTRAADEVMYSCGRRWGARFVMRNLRLGLRLIISLLLIANSAGFAQQRRKVIINQDCSGPGGSNMQTLLTLIQSPQVEVLGITVVSGNQWRDEEVAHTLRLLELI